MLLFIRYILKIKRIAGEKTSEYEAEPWKFRYSVQMRIRNPIKILAKFYFM